MVHKYLQRRGNIYYFRWRVPVDLRPILGVSELKQTLRTEDSLRAGARAAPLVLMVSDIQRVRQAYVALELNFDGYMATLRQLWVEKDPMSRKKTIKTGLITVGGMEFRYNDDPDTELAAVARAKEMGLIPQSLEPKQSNDATATGPMLSEVFADFLAHKVDKKSAQMEQRKPLSMKMQREYGRYFDGLIEIMGDVPLSSVTRKDLKDAILTYGSLPKRNLRLYKGVPIAELLEVEIPEEHRIKPKTAQQVAKLIQGVFSYAVDAELIGESPARAMKLSLDTARTSARYSDEEIRTILAASFKEPKPWKKWLPILAAYSGARRSELVQLRKKDVKIDSDTGRHYVLITEQAGGLKTKNATRQIPLHSELINKGFLGFIDSVKGDRLFGDLDPQALTKWFAVYRGRLGIDQFDDFGNRKTFHSIRHSFVTKSRGAGSSLDHVQQVVGHEKTSAGITDRYTHTQPLKVVLGVVDCIKYE